MNTSVPLTVLQLVMLAALLAACAPRDPVATIDVIQLLYEEQEAGIQPYPLRILVSPTHLRMDDGFDQSDFVLLDRLEQTIFSVSHSEKNIVVIKPAPLASTLPDGIELGREEVIDPGAPRISGKRPVHYRYTANQEVCLEVVSVSGLLVAAVQGLIEYGQILARQQGQDLDRTPGEYQTPCFLSRYVFAPTRELEQGLPVQEWDDAGYRRSLADFTERLQVSPELFVLPEGYTEFRLSQVSDG